MRVRRSLILVALALIIFAPGQAHSQLCTDAPLPANDCDGEQLDIRFIVDETVVVIVEGGNQRFNLNVDDIFENTRFFNFDQFTVRTGAITDYEFFVGGDAVMRRGVFSQSLPIEMLQLQLFAPGITGHGPVSINPKVVDFLPMVRTPDSHFLWEGTNNTLDSRNTFAPFNVRVDLSLLPSDALRSGTDLEFTLRFLAIER